MLPTITFKKSCCCCCTGSSMLLQLSLAAAHRLLMEVASLVVEYRL